MESDANIYATMYKDGSTYDEFFSKDPSLAKFLKTLPVGLKPNSTILDLGCGTGKPVAATLAALGHKVTDVDVSPDLVDLCGKNVPNADFETGDMLSYRPKHKFDCVLSVLSLFLFNRPEIERLAASWSDMVHPGGLLGIGTQLAEDVAKTYPETANTENGKLGVLEYDADGRAASNIAWWFMNAPERLTLFTRKGWHEMLKENGFDIVWENVEKFTPGVGSGCLPAMHCFMIARKREVSSL